MLVSMSPRTIECETYYLPDVRRLNSRLLRSLEAQIIDPRARTALLNRSLTSSPAVFRTRIAFS